MINTLKFIVNHPLNSHNKIGALARFAKWQINTRLNPYPIVYKFTENSKFLMWKGLAGATQNLYCGLHEFHDMGFLLHFLRPTDLFVDIGANVGSYTILSSAEIGAHTISIEPVPATFKSLEDNILINDMQDKVKPLNIGLGSAKGILKFTKSLDSINHVATEHETDTIDVPIDTLDNVLEGSHPVLLKIDVEGFETEVLKGASKILSSLDLKAVIIELNGSGKRYGYDEKKIHDNFLAWGFLSYQYNPFERRLTPISTFGTHNTIYIRDMEFVQNRVTTARKIKIRNREL